MSQWDATTYEGKDTILRVVREEAERFFALAEQPGAWDAPTACEGWSTADAVAHIIDTTESYFASFDAARAGGDDSEPYGVTGFAQRSNEQAIAFRNVPQHEMLDRLRSDFEKMMGILEPLGPDDWTGLMVKHFYMGKLPPWFFAAGQLMDYGVHSWDLREGAGRHHVLGGDAADLLVPFMFGLWQSTVKADADKTPFELGVRVLGRNGGDRHIKVDENGMSVEVGEIDQLPAVLEFDAASMVLVTFGRCNAGTVRGDPAIAERFLNQFFPI
jgi:uncharacterized protein (TIGR03083 family)